MFLYPTQDPKDHWRSHLDQHQVQAQPPCAQTLGVAFLNGAGAFFGLFDGLMIYIKLCVYVYVEGFVHV